MQRGFTYLWVLVAVAVISIGLLALSEAWVASNRRQKLVELEWIGNQLGTAIGSYYQATVGIEKSYPVSLEQLLDDRRSVTTRRHLRSIYLDPFTGKRDWDLLKGDDGTVRGVRAHFPCDYGICLRDFTYLPSDGVYITNVEPLH